jgi:hypothetical protein
MNKKDLKKTIKKAKKAIGRDDGVSKKKVVAAGIATAGLVGAGVATVLARKGDGLHSYHVKPEDEGWAITLDGEKAPLAHFPRKDEALSAARATAREGAPSRLFIHGQDGHVLESHQYEAEAATA